MKRNILYITALFALCGCSKEQPAAPAGNDGDPVPVYYSVTRALGEDAPPPPDENMVFMFVSYSYISGTTTDPVNYDPNPRASAGATTGYYRYMHDEALWKGIMQPCRITAPDSRWFSNTRDPQQGQALINGRYMSVCQRPATDLINNGNGSFRMLFTRTDERYASDPFPIHVGGYEVFPLPEPYNDSKFTVPLRDIRSKVWFEIIQGSDREFRIVDPQLINAGYWGWYHPLLKTTQISYEAGTKYETTSEFHDDDLSAPGDDSSATTPKTGRYSIYDKDDPYYQNATSIEALGVVDDAAPTDGTGEGDTIYGPAHYATPADGNGKTIYTTGRGSEQGIFFFANDYLSTDRYLQPGIYFKLQMGTAPDTSEFKINIPFDIDMKANHAYLFRLTVESSVIRVHYRAMPWEGFYDNGGDIGDASDWMTVGIWTPAGWTDHDMNNGDNNIGRRRK